MRGFDGFFGEKLKVLEVFFEKNFIKQKNISHYFKLLQEMSMIPGLGLAKWSLIVVSGGLVVKRIIKFLFKRNFPLRFSIKNRQKSAGFCL